MNLLRLYFSPCCLAVLFAQVIIFNIGLTNAISHKSKDQQTLSVSADIVSNGGQVFSSNQISGSGQDVLTKSSTDFTNCFKTAASSDLVWWKVDLKTVQKIGLVTISTTEDLSDFHLLLSNSNDANIIEGKVGASCFYQKKAIDTNVAVDLTCLGDGRYLTIIRNNNEGIKDMTLCSVKVYAAENLALHKPTKQIETLQPYVSGNAVDGNLATNVERCAHTTGVNKILWTPFTRQWWQVDLSSTYSISGVRITNRGDCCGDRLQRFEIRAGDMDGWENHDLCYSQVPPVHQGTTVLFNCNKVIEGRYVSVSLYGPGPLQLCEVEVYKGVKPQEIQKSSEECQFGEWAVWEGDCISPYCEQKRSRSTTNACQVTSSELFQFQKCTSTDCTSGTTGQQSTDTTTPAPSSGGFPTWAYIVIAIVVLQFWLFASGCTYDLGNHKTWILE